MKESTKILRDTILQRDVELNVEEQLDSLMGKQKKHTLSFSSNPLQEHIDGEWASRSHKVVWLEPSRLVGSGMTLGTWFPLEDFISRDWFVETLKIIRIER